MAKFQDKQRILKAAMEKQEITYKGGPIRLAADFSTETLQARRQKARNIVHNVKQNTAIKTILSSKALNKNGRPHTQLPRQKKAKQIQFHKSSTARDAKGTAVRRRRKRGKERGTQVQKE